LSYLADTSNGLLDTQREVNKLSMLGGGVGIGVKLRSADNKSTGIMPHMNTYDACSMAYRQDEIRRGSYAMYLDIDHPEIIPFIDMRKATGDHNVRCHNIHHAVNISDQFMNLVEKCMENSSTDDSWPLIDPHSKKVLKTISAKELWQKILDTRMRTGEPYLCFIDTCNRGMYPFQKAQGKKIHQSNLCSEIILATDENNTAVCCLSSLNLSKYDEWKDNSEFVKDVAEFLDNALTMFIERAPNDIYRAVRSASNERSIGIGVLGLHDYFQSKGISMESDTARTMNIQLFSDIKTRIDASNYILGAERGSPPGLIGTGRRFCCTFAVAPTASTSIIMGNTSPSIEPYRANAYRQDTLSGSHLTKNRHLDSIIKSRTVNGEKIWYNILMHSGSVQHLPDSILSTHEKNVFKTAFEIDPLCLVRLAADRQCFIDQAQSLNLFLNPNVDIKTLHLVHFLAWKWGLKTMYYLRSTKAAETDKLGETNIDVVPSVVSNPVPKACPLRRKGDDECFVCQ
jgi:ribonucleoside-diphosphate reductase alpha chain